MPLPSDGINSVSRGNDANNVVRPTNDVNGTTMYGRGGDDNMQGGRYDDDIIGGEGDDTATGGDGADLFRFYGDQIEGTSDYDRVFDLDFSEGDTVFLADYGLSFTDMDGADALINGTAVQISSMEGLFNLVEAFSQITAENVRDNNLLLTIDNGSGQTQVIELSNAWDDYLAVSSVSA